MWRGGTPGLADLPELTGQADTIRKRQSGCSEWLHAGMSSPPYFERSVRRIGSRAPHAEALGNSVAEPSAITSARCNRMEEVSSSYHRVLFTGCRRPVENAHNLHFPS